MTKNIERLEGVIKRKWYEWYGDELDREGIEDIATAILDAGFVHIEDVDCPNCGSLKVKNGK